MADLGIFADMLFRGMTVVTLAMLAACSSDPVPVEPDPAPTTTSTPSIAVPAMPAQATEDSPEGAAAFVKHYVDVFNYAAATGDVDELSRLSSPDCEGCQSYIDLYRETYEAGGYFKGGDWKIGKIQIEFRSEESYATARVTSEQSKFKATSLGDEQTGSGTDTELTFAVAPPAPVRKITQLVLKETT